MCGIVGIAGPLAGTVGQDWLRRALPTLHHRGPDAQSTWLGEDVALGHARLAILDLSPTGAQPMMSQTGRSVIAYNGEVYGFEALAQRLEMQRRGHSDTEVVLEHLERRGPAGLADLHGMFGLALWDCRDRRLLLARDRTGIKPLYFADVPGTGVAFASEIKPLRDLPGVDLGLNATALALFLALGYVPAPWTLCRGIRQLLPGEQAIVDADGRLHVSRFVPAIGHPHDDVPRDPRDQDAALESLLMQAVADQLVADVPVGVLLSGGVDSSVVAAAAARSVGRIRTFSIVHADPRYDEREAARAVASHLGSEHTEIEVSRDAMSWDELHGLVDHHGDPFADSSSLITRRLAAEVRRHVTVALSGDGGDELFAGYPRYVINQQVAQVRHLPRLARAAALRAYDLLPDLRNDRAAGLARRVARALAVADRPVAERAVGTLTFFWPDEQMQLLLPGLAPDADVLARLVADRAPGEARPDLPDACHRMEQRLVLPDDMLTKVDRMTMAESLEIRPPLLDDRLVHFAAGLPIGRKLHGREGKAILKTLARRLVPPWVIDRPKMGFAVPLLSFGGRVLTEATRWALEAEDSPLHQVFRPEALAALRLEFQRRGDGKSPEDSAYRRAHRQWLLVVLALAMQRGHIHR